MKKAMAILKSGKTLAAGVLLLVFWGCSLTASVPLNSDFRYTEDKAFVYEQYGIQFTLPNEKWTMHKMHLREDPDSPTYRFCYIARPKKYIEVLLAVRYWPAENPEKFLKEEIGRRKGAIPTTFAGVPAMKFEAKRGGEKLKQEGIHKQIRDTYIFIHNKNRMVFYVVVYSIEVLLRQEEALQEELDQFLNSIKVI